MYTKILVYFLGCLVLKVHITIWVEIGREAMFLAVMQHDSKISPVLCNYIPI